MSVSAAIIKCDNRIVNYCCRKTTAFRITHRLQGRPRERRKALGATSKKDLENRLRELPPLHQQVDLLERLEELAHARQRPGVIDVKILS